MDKIQCAMRALAVVLFTLAFGSVARAQATRTWVSGVGDDVNPCSRTAPCKTFAGAISKTAAGGVIDVLDSGGFGAVTITKSITIENEGSVAGVLVSGTNGIIVNAGPTDMVMLRGLTIEGVSTGLNGIRFLGGLALFVENCEINRFKEKGIDFEPGGTTASYLFVKDTTIRNHNFGTGGGILIQPGPTATASVSLDRVRIERNAFGVKAEDRSTVTIRDSILARNANEGVWAFSAAAPTVVNVHDSTVTLNNQVGIKSEGANATVRISGASILSNAVGLMSLSSGAIASFGDNNNADGGAPTTTLPKQ